MKIFFVAAILFSMGLNPAAKAKEFNLADSEGKPVRLDIHNKNTAIIFLSTKCICSPEQLISLKEISDLAAKDPSQRILVLYAEPLSSLPIAQKHFGSLGLKLSFYMDVNYELTKDLKVKKTPHSFLFEGHRKVYEGGILADQIPKKDYPLLLSALEDLGHHRKIKYPSGKSIGCNLSIDGHFPH